MPAQPSRADKWITGSAATVVAGVAGTAGWVSYTHALAVVRLAGGTGAVAYAYPTFIDGMVYMSSMVLLMAARRKAAAPALAWWALAAGIALTLVANVYSMASHGLLGAVAGSLPALALVLSYELLMWLIRSRSAAPVTEPAVFESAPMSAPEPAAPEVHPELNGHAERARSLFAADLVAGELPSVRRIRREMWVGQPRAQQVQAYLTELTRN